MINQVFRLAFIIVTVMSLFSTTNAQITNVTPTTTLPTHGAGHDYINMLNETVSPVDGSLSVRVALPVPESRGLTLPFAFTYDSNYSGLQPNPGRPGQAAWSDSHDVFNPGQPLSALITGSMWSNTLPQLTDVLQKFTLGGGPGSPPPCFSTGGYIFKDASGGRHSLRLSAVLTSSSNPAFPNCTAANWSNYLTGGDDFFQAILSGGAGSNTSDPAEGSVSVADADGTVYNFSGNIDFWSCVSYNQSVTVAYSMPKWIEDRNGNKIAFSNSCAGQNFSISDTTGRTALSFQYANSKISSATVSGITTPYVLTWGTFGGSINLNFVATGANTHTTNCFGIGAWQAAATELQYLTLPNNQRYQFQYDPSSGLLTKITYPTGGYISYQWGINPLSETTSFADNGGNADFCQYTYDKPALLHRYVSYDGSTIAEQQDFSYSTTWQSNPIWWASKQTTVTTHDLVSGTTFNTVYSYSPNLQAPPPNSPAHLNVQMPVEASVTYYDPNGNVLRTVSKGWQDPYEEAGETTTLENGLSSSFSYTWGPGHTITDKQEWDFGAPTTGAPTRETQTTYQSFAVTPIYPSSPSILNRPATVSTYGSGTLQAQTIYAYDQNTIASVTNLPTSTHDETNYAASLNPPRGNATTVTRKCIGCTDATTTYTFDETGQTLSMVDPCGNVACSDMTGSSHTITYSYSDSYTILSGGLNVSYTPTASTNTLLTQITDPLGHVSQFTYDFNAGQLTVSKNQNDISGNLTGSTYVYADSLTRPSLLQNSDGGQTSFAYNDSTYSQVNNTPNVQKAQLIISGSSLTHTTAMDGITHPARTLLTSDPAGTDTGDITYDGLGRVRTKTNPHRSGSFSTDGTTTYNYDALGRPTSVVKADGSTSTITYFGNCSTVTDEAGKSRKSCSDAFGRLTQVFEDPTTLNYETDYTYDAIGNLLTVNQKGGNSDSSNWRTRTFTYDSLSRLLTAINPESGTLTYTYDVNGNVSTKKDARNITITYGYDVLNRLTSKTYSNGDGAVSYSYDAFASGTNYGIGRRTGMTDSSGSTTWTYDTMGRVWSEKRIIGSVNKTISTQYNLDGSVKQITYPSGSVLAYSYDADAHLTQVKDTAHNITYFQSPSYYPTGELNQATYGSVVETSIYNNRLQPCWYYATTGTPLGATTVCSGTATAASVLDLKYSFGFGTNDNGNVLNLTNNKDSNRSVAYTYDPLNRIASASTLNTDCSALPSGITKNWGEAFTIDAWGNLTNRNVTKCSAEPLSLVALNNNRLSGFGYDADGNMTSNGGASYTYSAESRLKTAGGVTYTYNGDGERVKKSNGTLYWGSGPLLESDLSGNLQREFIFAAGKRIARRDISGGTIYYYFTDHLGSADVVTNSAGAIQNESDYYPYGGERVYSQTLANQNYKFTGKERDTESGLDNFGARYDTSSLGRFMTPDWSGTPTTVPYAKFGDPQTLNLYSYVINNPIDRVDADGHCSWLFRWSERLCNGVDYGHFVPNENLNDALQKDADQARRLLSGLTGLEMNNGQTFAEWAAMASNRQVVDFERKVANDLYRQSIADAFRTTGPLTALTLTFPEAQLQHEFSHAGDFGVNGNWNKQAGADFQKALQDIINGPNTREYVIEFRGQSGFRAFLDQPSGKAVIFDQNGVFRAAWDLGRDQIRGVVVNGKLW